MKRCENCGKTADQVALWYWVGYTMCELCFKKRLAARPRLQVARTVWMLIGLVVTWTILRK